MKKLFLVFSLFFLCYNLTFSQEKIIQILGDPTFTYLHKNYISTVLFNNGIADIDQNTSNSGLVYPKLSGKTAVFISGLLWGTKIVGDEIPHVGGSAYRSGLQPGKILNSGLPWDQLTFEDPNDPSVRIYRTRRDVYPGGPLVDLSEEALIESRSVEEIRQQYETDWLEWPADDGAPYEDINSNGVYDPAYDIPGYKGADQTIWFVANDCNQAYTQNLYGSNPIGMEIQVTIWSYQQHEAVNHVFFKRYKLINKSNTNFDSTYISFWTDPDIGVSTDDFAGCDSTLDLGYVYNATDYDEIYEFTPPAFGITLLKGPRISANTNLDMTAGYYFSRGDVNVMDPSQGDPQGSIQFYNFMQGRYGLSGQPFEDPTGNITKYCLNGDPIAGTGWLDGLFLPSGDRRMGISSGPFNMAPGDTQEVYFSEALGIGEDRLESIKYLRFHSILSKQLFENNFEFTRSPVIATPLLEIEQVDNNFNLNWNVDSSLVNSIENFDQDGFSFQGYNVYQLPSSSTFQNNAKRIAIFDKLDGITNITGSVMGPNGYPIGGTIFPGTNSGILRQFVATSDVIDNTYFIPGKKYYFAVTAYGYNPSISANPNTTESLLSILEVTFEDSSVWATYGQVLDVIHSNGNGSATIKPTVVDPYQLTNHQYKIFFTQGLGDIEWNLKDLTSGTDVLLNQNNFNGDHTSPIVDGLQLKVTKESGFRNFSVVSNASGILNPPQAGSFHFAGFPTPDNLDPAAGFQQSTNNSRWGIHTADNGLRGDYNSFLSRTTRDGSNWPSIIPYDFELRFTSIGGWAYDAYNTGTNSFPVPFEIWNIGAGTPDDVSDDYRMIPYLVDDDASGTFNIPLPGTKQFGTDDHTVSDGGNDPYTDWIYWMLPEDQTPGQSGYLSAEALMQAGTYSSNGNEVEAMARMVLVEWNGGSAPPYTADMPETGTIFRIESSKPPVVGVDEFTFQNTILGGIENPSVLDNFNLEQNFPNPFNPTTTIRFTLSEKSLVNLSVYNILGQKVSELINSELISGQHSIMFNGNELASGVYFYRLQTGEFNVTKKMILLK